MKTHLSSKKSLDGNYVESDLPLLIQRRGMAAWEDGIVRILDRRKLPNKVDFILTDPPYANHKINTVPYFSMESVYTCWLEKIDKSYQMDFENEFANEY